MTSMEHSTSIVCPLMVADIGQVLPMARLLQQRGGTGRLWLGQSLRVETHQVFAALTGMGVRIPMGSGVALAPLRHPYDAAMQARSVAALSGMPYVAGIGPAAPEFQRSLRKDPYAAPLAAMREYVSIMRRLLADEHVDFAGDHYHVRGRLVPQSHSSVELGLGVLRPRMARLAGAVADVAVTWMTPAHYVADTLVPALAEGATAADRPRPRVATMVHVAVARPGRDIRRTALAGAGAHLGAAHYTDMLRRSGVEAWPDDPAAGADALVKSGVFVSGSADEIARELDVYRRSGVDEIGLNPAGVIQSEGLGAAMTDLEDIFAALDRLHG